MLCPTGDGVTAAATGYLFMEGRKIREKFHLLWPVREGVCHPSLSKGRRAQLQVVIWVFGLAVLGPQIMRFAVTTAWQNNHVVENWFARAAQLAIGLEPWLLGLFCILFYLAAAFSEYRIRTSK